MTKYCTLCLHCDATLFYFVIVIFPHLSLQCVAVFMFNEEFLHVYALDTCTPK